MNYLPNQIQTCTCLSKRFDHVKSDDLKARCAEIKRLRTGKIKSQSPLPIRQGRSNFIRNLYPVGEPEIVEVDNEFRWIAQVTLRINHLSVKPETSVMLIHQPTIFTLEENNIQSTIIGNFGEDEEVLSQTQFKIKSDRIFSFSQKWQGDFTGHQWKHFTFLLRSKIRFALERKDVPQHIQIKLDAPLLYGDEEQTETTGCITPDYTGIIIKTNTNNELNDPSIVPETDLCALIIDANNDGRNVAQLYQYNGSWNLQTFPDTGSKFLGPFIPIPLVEGVEVGYRAYTLSSASMNTGSTEISDVVKNNDFINDSRNLAQYKKINENLLQLQSNVVGIAPITGMLTRFDTSLNNIQFNNPNNVLTFLVSGDPNMVSLPQDVNEQSFGFFVVPYRIGGCQFKAFYWDTSNKCWKDISGTKGGSLPDFPFGIIGFQPKLKSYQLINAKKIKSSWTTIYDSFHSESVFDLPLNSWYTDENGNTYKFMCKDLIPVPQKIEWSLVQ